MIKKLPSTSYRALAIVLAVIVLLILVIAFEIWTGRTYGKRGTTWAENPVSFALNIGFTISIIACLLVCGYVMLLRAVRVRRKNLPGSKKQP